MDSGVSTSELIQGSGLSFAELDMLEEVGLLRPDWPNAERPYRQRLVRWASRLAYLLKEGWTVEEIQYWSKTRWTSSDPRRWPPQRM